MPSPPVPGSEPPPEPEPVPPFAIAERIPSSCPEIPEREVDTVVLNCRLLSATACVMLLMAAVSRLIPLVLLEIPFISGTTLSPIYESIQLSYLLSVDPEPPVSPPTELPILDNRFSILFNVSFDSRTSTGRLSTLRLIRCVCDAIKSTSVLTPPRYFSNVSPIRITLLEDTTLLFHERVLNK